MSTIEDKNHSKSHRRVSQNRSGGGLARHLVLKTLSSIKLGLLHIVDGPDTHTFWIRFRRFSRSHYLHHRFQILQKHTFTRICRIRRSLYSGMVEDSPISPRSFVYWHETWILSIRSMGVGSGFRSPSSGDITFLTGTPLKEPKETSPRTTTCRMRFSR